MYVYIYIIYTHKYCISSYRIYTTCLYSVSAVFLTRANQSFATSLYSGGSCLPLFKCRPLLVPWRWFPASFSGRRSLCMRARPSGCSLTKNLCGITSHQNWGADEQPRKYAEMLFNWPFEADICCVSGNWGLLPSPEGSRRGNMMINCRVAGILTFCSDKLINPYVQRLVMFHNVSE